MIGKVATHDRWLERPVTIRRRPRRTVRGTPAAGLLVDPLGVTPLFAIAPTVAAATAPTVVHVLATRRQPVLVPKR